MEEASALAIQKGIRGRSVRRQMEQAVHEVNSLSELFLDADKSTDGRLSKDELASVMKAYFKRNHVAKNMLSVSQSVRQPMMRYELDGSNTLELGEFIAMIGEAKEFAFNSAGVGTKDPLVMEMVAQIGRSMAYNAALQKVAAEINQAGLQGVSTTRAIVDAGGASTDCSLESLCLGAMARTKLDDVSRAASYVQAALRGRHDREGTVAQSVINVITLQGGVHGRTHRLRVHEALDTLYGDLARVIQGGIRGMAERQQAPRRMEEANNDAAVMVNDAARVVQRSICQRTEGSVPAPRGRPSESSLTSSTLERVV